MKRAQALARADSVPPGLVYVSDDRPGIRRVRNGEGFVLPSLELFLPIGRI